MNKILDRLSALESNQEQLIRIRINNSTTVDHSDFESMYHYQFSCQSCGEEFGQDYFLNADQFGCKIKEVCETIGCTNEAVMGVLK